VTDFAAVSGHGVRTTVDGQPVLLGNRKLMEAEEVALGELTRQAEGLAAQARTPMYVAVDGQAAGIVAVSDPIKADSREAIARLHAIGLKVAMLTGDNRATAQVVPKEVGIDEVSADMARQVDAAADRHRPGRQPRGSGVESINPCWGNCPIAAAGGRPSC